jgi:hypothetical protein
MNEKLKKLLTQAWIETKIAPENCYLTDDYEVPPEFVRFDELVRADEREACADLVFQMAQLPKYENNWLPLHHAQSAIRARGVK